MLTIAFITNRVYPCWEWYFASLRLQLDDEPVQLIVVDFHHADRPNSLPAHILHVPPKPTVWQGPHRLTARDYFAAANSRNTALCLARGSWIAYADDLAVLTPGWMNSVREAMQTGYVVCGAYRKVNALEVIDGKVVSFSDYKNGHDSRWNAGHDDMAVRAGPGCLFGCSLALPVDLLLDVNGWDESCDGMGYEDCALGIMLTRRGVDVRYDRRMLTFESEEMHHLGETFLRIDKKIPGERGPDASHAMVRASQSGTAVNAHFGAGGIAALREKVLAGEPFPIVTEPQRHWPDNQPLAEM